MPVTPVPTSAAATRAPFGAPFAGVLLDLDGTLIDSIAAVERSWIRWCGEYGIDPVKLLGFHGIPAAGVIETLLPEGQRAAAFERIRDIEVADVDGIVVLPGAEALLAALAARLVDLTTIPGVGGDEAWYGVQMGRFVRGEPFETRTPTGLALNPFFAWWEAPLLLASPPRAWVLRAPAVGSGLLAIAAAYLALKRPMGTRAASMPTKSATVTEVPRAAPMRKASFTSPIPMPDGYASAAASRKPEAPTAPIAISSRSQAKLAMISLKPPFSSPSRFSAGTSTSVKEISPVSEECHPIFSSLRLTS